MKCMINDMEAFELNPTQVNILAHVIPYHEIEDHLKGLIQYIVGQKLRECAGKLFEEWKPKMIKEGIQSVPIMDIDLAKMIFERPDYVNSLMPPIDEE